VSARAGGKEQRRKVAPRLWAAPAASDARVVGQQGTEYYGIIILGITLFGAMEYSVLCHMLIRIVHVPI
jgi:hypothetical protein